MGKAPHSFAAGRRLHLAGKIRQAEKIYRRLLTRDPGDAEALHALGVIAFQNGQLEPAAELIGRALAAKPSEPVYHHNLGQLREAQGRPAEAVACFERALQMRPDSLDSLRALSRLLFSQGREAAAVPWLRRYAQIEPDNPEALVNLAGALLKAGETEEAAEACERALRLNPALAEAHHNLGLARIKQHRFVSAEACFRAALRLQPDHVKSQEGLAGSLLDQGLPEASAAAFREALRLSPGSAAAHSNLLFCLNHAAGEEPADLFAEHQRWAQQHAAPLAGLARSHANGPDPERPLRIGYVSPDFRLHPAAFFFGPILGSHDREQFTSYLYSSVLRPDALTERLRSLAGVWRDVSRESDQGLADLVRQDGIDILVDLAGHTGDNRLLAFARKPAPVQVTYLGYPNTTGLAAIAYRITDAWADPPGQTEQWHTEELVRLPSGFLCYESPADAPPVAPPPLSAGGGFTFGSFNRLAKIGPEVVAAWSSILRRVPGSRLVLKTKACGEEATRRRVLAMFAGHGIAASRVELWGSMARVTQHLDAYGQIDLALDTFPYNGTTTTCEALWMGVPVVALAGRTHASRVSFSLLSRLGLGEFVAGSIEGYIELAARLSQDGERLRELRAGLRDRMARSPLSDARTLTRELEDAYRAMWRRWCSRPAAIRRIAPRANATETPLPQTAAASRPPSDPGESLRRRIASFPYWYHRIELPGGVVTPGWAPLNRDAYRIPADLAGKRLLDVGAWDGFWTFEALRRGARQVVAVDDFSDFLGSLGASDRRAWETFDLCREALGYSEERCQRVDLSVYDVSEQRLGRFDIVFFFGTLYHLRYPMLALDRLAAVCNEEIYVESAILDDFSPYRGGLGRGYPGGQMVAEFYPDNQYGNNATNWWAPTLHCLGHMVRAAGFPTVQGWKLTAAPADLPSCRGFVKGSKL
ncbi:MAG TPA: tetratricopeptide repeat protein, partial [Bryobacterales bacterium]|nr:tetratricopeptide repeat protein [Bryobacterales bacterium]